MRFSQLLSQLSEVQAAGGTEGLSHNLADDPELRGAAALDQSGPGELSFLEPGNALAAALAASGATAVLLPAKGDEVEALQQQATERGQAWIALRDPRLAFAEALDALFPRKPKPPGIHASAVVDPEAVVGMGSHVGAHVVIGAQVQIGASCTIHPNVVIYDDVQIGDGCELHAGAVLHPGSRLGRGCVVHSTAVVGSEGFGFVPTAQGWRKMPQTGLVVLEDGVEVGCGSTIDRPSVGETRIGAGTKIDNLVHIRAAPWRPRWALPAALGSATA